MSAFSNEELQFKKTPWVIGKFLRGWQMNVPDGHIYGSDINVFLSHIRPKIITKLKNELSELKNIKFQLAIINVKNKDNDCFRWAIKSALFPTDSHSDRTSSYPSNEDDG